MMIEDDRIGSRVLDPLLNLSLPSPATSLCFVGNNQHSPTASASIEGENSDSYTSESDEDLPFRSSRLAATTCSAFKQEQRRELLKNRLLVSCHQNGDARIWDCEKQRAISNINPQRDGAGMAVKRCDDHAMIMYQTRDQKGTVSIHSVERFGSSASLVREYETYSSTFCTASPCRGNAHLMALPSRQETGVTVMDDRDRVPAFATSLASDHGMVTSLAIASSAGGRPVLACGMESGSVVFYDFSSGRIVKGEYSLTRDPILALDLVSSVKAGVSESKDLSVVAVAGMAGDSLEVAEMPEPEQGRIAVMKAGIDNFMAEEPQWTIRTRWSFDCCWRLG
jgi:WD40 repeat protein